MHQKTKQKKKLPVGPNTYSVSYTQLIWLVVNPWCSLWHELGASGSVPFTFKGLTSRTFGLEWFIFTFLRVYDVSVGSVGPRCGKIIWEVCMVSFSGASSRFKGSGRRRWSPAIQFLHISHEEFVPLFWHTVQNQVPFILLQDLLNVRQVLLWLLHQLTWPEDTKLKLHFKT